MDVLITGGGGAIGTALAAGLASSNHAVVVYDLKGEDLPTQVWFVQGDVRDFRRLASAAAGCNCGIVAACSAALEIDPAKTKFEVLNIVGARRSRERFHVAAAEERLGIKLRHDFAAYE